MLSWREYGTPQADVARLLRSPASISSLYSLYTCRAGFLTVRRHNGQVPVQYLLVCAIRKTREASRQAVAGLRRRALRNQRRLRGRRWSTLGT